MMQDGIDREAQLIIDGFDAVGGHRMLAIGPHAEVQAGLCTKMKHVTECLAIDGSSVLPRGVTTIPVAADEVWRLCSIPRSYEMIVVDRVYPVGRLFGIFTSVVPILAVGGIIIVHSYSDFLDDKPYRCQNDSLVAISLFMNVNLNFSKRKLAGQVVELSKTKEGWA